MPADGAGSLDDETKEITFISRRREINVSSRYIGGAIILQWQEIDMAWGGHDDRRGIMEILRQLGLELAIETTHREIAGKWYPVDR